MKKRDMSVNITLFAKNNFDVYLASVVIQSIIANANNQKQYKIFLLYLEISLKLFNKVYILCEDYATPYYLNV